MSESCNAQAEVLAAFLWPKPPGAPSPPRWSDGLFRLDGQPRRVICDDAADSHRSPELTDLHEAEAGSRHAAEKKALVARQIRHTSDSALLDAALRMEETLGRFVSFPFGIRCVAVFRQPARRVLKRGHGLNPA